MPGLIAIAAIGTLAGVFDLRAGGLMRASALGERRLLFGQGLGYRFGLLLLEF